MVNASQANGPYNWAPISAVIPSETLRIGGACSHTIQSSTSGTITGSYRLEGSLDGVNFFDMSGPLDASTSLMTHITYKPVGYVRVNVTAFSGTGSLSFYYFGS